MNVKAFFPIFRNFPLKMFIFNKFSINNFLFNFAN